MGTDQIKLIHTFAHDRLLTFGPPISADGLATLWWQGKRLEEFVALEKWRGYVGRFPSRFGCSFCNEPVIWFPPVPPKSVGIEPFRAGTQTVSVQCCRCTLIQFEFAPPFETGDQWVGWQADYLREMQDPMPFASLRGGCLMGELDEKGSAWMPRHTGVPEGIKFYSNGTVGVGKSHISFGESSTQVCVNGEEHTKIVGVMGRHYDGGVELPEYVFMVGNDPDYVWSSDIDRAKIVQLPFRCDFCKAWVKMAPLGFPAYDRELGCLCHLIDFRKGVAHPTDYRQLARLVGVG